MLCSSKTKRPDKRLEKRLLFLAYSLVALTAVEILFLLYPEYFLYLTLLLVALSAFCLLSTIKTLNAGEEAISYGGFANELMQDREQGRRIDNASFEPVLENDLARDFFKSGDICDFLSAHLSDNRQNKNAFSRLQTALNNLTAEKVNLALRQHRDDKQVFGREEWFEISVRPVYLKKTDIFEGPYSIKKIRRDTFSGRKPQPA